MFTVYHMEISVMKLILHVQELWRIPTTMIRVNDYELVVIILTRGIQALPLFTPHQHHLQFGDHMGNLFYSIDFPIFNH